MTTPRDDSQPEGLVVYAAGGSVYLRRDASVVYQKQPTLNLHGNTPRTTTNDYVRLAIILCLDGQPNQ